MKITNVQLVEHLQDELDMCRLEFDGGADSAYIIWNHTNLVEYLGGEAVVTFRQDLYKGTVSKFVNTLAKVGVIHTLERETNIKLYTDETDNHSTVSFSDIEDGSTVQGAIVYVVGVTFDSSARATWCDFSIMDRSRKIAKLRLFNPSTKDSEFKGRYIMCDLRRNKYGLSTDKIVTVDATFSYSPEVTIAAKYVTDSFAEEPEILAVLQESSFISFAKTYVVEEPGYDLVRLAIEIDLCNEMSSLVQGVNFKLVRQALLFSHFHILNQTSPYIPEIVGFASVNKFRFSTKQDVQKILYSEDVSLINERTILRTIQQSADTAIRVKKGMV